VTTEGFGYDPERGELWFAGETAEALLLELQARRRSLASELDVLRTRLEAPIPEAAYSLEPNPVADRSLQFAQRLLHALDVSLDHVEAPLRGDVDAGATRSGELGGELRRLGAAEVELRQELGAASEAVSALEIEAARVETEADEARRRLEHANADEPAEGDDREQLVASVERLERRRETLGQVNPLAHEEYEAEKARLEELAAQRADLEASLAELEKLRTELTETVERRFAETFDAVQRHFAEVTATVFPGGEGRLRLTEPEADEEDEDEPGVEVELRPAGKRVQRLSLLSGGEKALTAISLLTAIFQYAPSPFCILDEVDAPLDEANIGRFTELIKEMSLQTQFVLITHSKKTMSVAPVMYGVTMQEPGVSKLVSVRFGAA
jgi:chromosome segregation protein